MLQRFKHLMAERRTKTESGPFLNRILFLHAHNAGMTGDDSIFLKTLRTPGYNPSPSTLNYAMMQMLYGCHMIQTSGILPVGALDAVIARGAYVDPALAPSLSRFSRLFGASHDRANPDFLTPLWHAVELANQGRREYLARLLQEPIAWQTLAHFLPQLKDQKMAQTFSMLIERRRAAQESPDHAHA